MLQVGETGIEKEEKEDIKWRTCPSQKFVSLLHDVTDDKFEYVKEEIP
jgi:hypothetical protein